MQRRTLLLFAVMLALFAVYATMSMQAMPELKSGLKAQTDLLNNLDSGVTTPTAKN